MEPTSDNFCHILLYYFREGKNAAHVAKQLRDLYGDKALKETQCRSLFLKFHSVDFSVCQFLTVDI